MTDEKKLSKIRWLLMTHFGEKHDLAKKYGKLLSRSSKRSDLMISAWYVFWSFLAGSVCGFFLYGCIDWKKDNWGK